MKKFNEMNNTELKQEYNKTLNAYYNYGYDCIHYALLGFEEEFKKRNIKL
jgi:hypothetical protein